jgi:DNA-binding PucR family transcriptional regulator
VTVITVVTVADFPSGTVRPGACPRNEGGLQPPVPSLLQRASPYGPRDGVDADKRTIGSRARGSQRRPLRAIVFHRMVSRPRANARIHLSAETRRLSELISTRSQTRPMSDFVQLDLFGDRPDFDRPPDAASLQPVLAQELSDEELIAAIPEVTLADACALAAEAGKRRLSAAIPALVTLCNRFVGYGIDV